MKECERNLEAIWLIQNLKPNFRVIAKFRQHNPLSLKKVFGERNRFCAECGLFGYEYVATDGSEFKEVNSKERNFTLPKIEERVNMLNRNIEEFMPELEKNDTNDTSEKRFTKEEIVKRIIKLKEQKKRCEGYADIINSGERSQISLTDPESKLMKFREGLDIQTAVDAKNHIISDFLTTDKITDTGLIYEAANGVTEIFVLETIETVEDKGCHDFEDTAKCLENGIIPNAIPTQRGGDYELTVAYEETEISEAEQKKLPLPMI